MQNPSSGFLAFLTGSTVTLTEIIREGSLWLTFGGAALALVGGVWTYRTAKIRFKIAMAELKQVELELERASGLHNGEPPKKRTHHR
jgi:hypothetical protein